MDPIGWCQRHQGREGQSEHEIARTTGLSRNTAAKTLGAQVQPPKYRPGGGLQAHAA